MSRSSGRGRPGQGDGLQDPAKKSGLSVPQRARAKRTDREWAASALDDVWVLVVQPAAEGRYRRRVFLSVEPAWQAARRAADRGQRADVVLCRLEPVGGDDR